jgi:asparagine synthase (glutamine-hydrolysing)
MCRIYGFFGGGEVSPARIAAAQRVQLHGGPDQQGWRLNEGWCLGCNRLVIQGLAHGKQPYSDGSIDAVFNGEIYNHGELREQLARRGRVVEGNCDGEIVPYLYAEFGLDMFEMLDGMFAIAIVDHRGPRPRLILSCDHLSIKSLYYLWDRRTGRLTFASELEGLAALSDAPLVLREETIDDVFSFRAPLGAATMFEGVHSLRPAELLILDWAGTVRQLSYHPLSAEPPSGSEESPESLRTLLQVETERLLKADVPACLVTSGGLDSSLLTALARRSGRPIDCFNIGYCGSWPADERHFAREVANHVEASYHQVELDPDVIPGMLKRMVRHLGCPNSAPHSLSTFALFEAVAASGYKVAITGEGADELFAGYDRFGYDQSATGWVDRYLDSFAAVPRSMREQLYHPDFRALTNSSTEREAVREALLSAAADGLEGLLQFELVERFPNYILRRVDHLSMAHAVEVRVPFCQWRVREWARHVPRSLKIAGHERKIVLTKAAEGLLPSSILCRPKQPFTLPIKEMIRPGELLFDFIADTIQSLSFRNRHVFSASIANELLRSQSEKRDSTAAQALWMMAVCELWIEHQEEFTRWRPESADHMSIFARAVEPSRRALKDGLVAGKATRPTEKLSAEPQVPGNE